MSKLTCVLVVFFVKEIAQKGILPRDVISHTVIPYFNIVRPVIATLSGDICAAYADRFKVYPATSNDNQIGGLVMSFFAWGLRSHRWSALRTFCRK